MLYKKFSSASIRWTHIVWIEKLKTDLLNWLGQNDAASNVKVIVDTVISHLSWSWRQARSDDLVNIQSKCLEIFFLYFSIRLSF